MSSVDNSNRNTQILRRLRVPPPHSSEGNTRHVQTAFGEDKPTPENMQEKEVSRHACCPNKQTNRRPAHTSCADPTVNGPPHCKKTPAHPTIHKKCRPATPQPSTCHSGNIATTSTSLYPSAGFRLCFLLPSLLLLPCRVPAVADDCCGSVQSCPRSCCCGCFTSATLAPILVAAVSADD